MGFALSVPTFSTGYARMPQHSAFSNLWVGLVGLWAPFLGPQGSTLVDMSRQRNDLTLTNMAGDDWIEGVPGWALDFDGSNDHAINNAIPNYGATNNISLAVWFKGTGTGRLLAVGTSGNSSRHYIYVDTGPLIKCVVNNAAGSIATGNAPTGDWQLAVMVYDKVNVVLYENGRQVASRSTTGNLDTTAKVAIGAAVNASNFFTGRIGFAAYWDRPLAPSEVQLLWAGATPLHRAQSGTRRAVL